MLNTLRACFITYKDATDHGEIEGTIVIHHHLRGMRRIMERSPIKEDEAVKAESQQNYTYLTTADTFGVTYM